MSTQATQATQSFGAGWLERFPEHEIVIGPIQRSEAIMLYGLIKTIRPRRVVEVGFYRGDSCAVLCAATAGDPDATVESYDVRWVDENDKNSLKAQYPHLTVEICDQRQVMSRTAASDSRLIDFLFIDASHDLEINQATWASFVTRMSSNAVVMVHDTGLWVDTHRPPDFTHGRPGTKHGVTGRFHQPDEVMFVQWIEKNFPNWTRMDFMSVNAFRHGFTLLQRTQQVQHL